MFRTTPVRSLVRSTLSGPKASLTRSAVNNGLFKAQLSSAVRAHPSKHSKTLALACQRTPTTALIRYKSTSGAAPKDLPAIYYEKLKPDVEHTSMQSSVRHVSYEQGIDNEEPDVDMMAGVKQDMV